MDIARLSDNMRVNENISGGLVDANISGQVGKKVNFFGQVMLPHKSQVPTNAL